MALRRPDERKLGARNQYDPTATRDSERAQPLSTDRRGSAAKRSGCDHCLPLAVRHARHKPSKFLSVCVCVTVVSPPCLPRLISLASAVQVFATHVVRLTRRHNSPFHPRASTRWTDYLSTLEFRELPSDTDTITQRREDQQ